MATNTLVQPALATERLEPHMHTLSNPYLDAILKALQRIEERLQPKPLTASIATPLPMPPPGSVTLPYVVPGANVFDAAAEIGQHGKRLAKLEGASEAHEAVMRSILDRLDRLETWRKLQEDDGA